MRVYPRFARDGALVLLLSLLSSTASADMSAPWTTISQINMNAAWGMQSASLMKRQAKASARRQANSGYQFDRASTPRSMSSQQSGAAAPNLAVANDPAVSAQARQEFIAGLAQSSGQPVADEADRLFGDVRTTFSRMVAPYGLRSNDFGDIMAAYMVVMWMAANRQTELPQLPQVQAVRGQMRGFFASTLENAGDAAHRQLLAETAMYQTCMAVAIREQAQSQAKPELLDSMAAAIDRTMSEQGFQLRTLALTDQGFSKH